MPTRKYPEAGDLEDGPVSKSSSDVIVLDDRRRRQQAVPDTNANNKPDEAAQMATERGTSRSDAFQRGQMGTAGDFVRRKLETVIACLY